MPRAPGIVSGTASKRQVTGKTFDSFTLPPYAVANREREIAMNAKIRKGPS